MLPALSRPSVDYRSIRSQLAHNLAGVGAGGMGVSFGTTAPDFGNKIQGARQGFSPIGIGRGRYIKSPINPTPFFRDPEAVAPAQGGGGGPSPSPTPPPGSDTAPPDSGSSPIQPITSASELAQSGIPGSNMNIAMPDPNDPSTWYWYDTRAANPLLMQ